MNPNSIKMMKGKYDKNNLLEPKLGSKTERNTGLRSTTSANTTPVRSRNR